MPRAPSHPDIEAFRRSATPIVRVAEARDIYHDAMPPLDADHDLTVHLDDGGGLFQLFACEVEPVNAAAKSLLPRASAGGGNTNTSR